MNPTTAIVCRLPYCHKHEERQTDASTVIRAGAIALGMIAIGLSILIRVPLVGYCGAPLLLGGILIKRIKIESSTNSEERTKAAIKIQSIVRGNRDRLVFKKLRAAIKIQSVARGYRDRKQQEAIIIARLPKITYCDFETQIPQPIGAIDHGPSCICATGGRIKEGRGIGFINGIQNTIEDAQASARYISTLSGGYKVHFVYNATHGAGRDLQECHMGLQYIATEPVTMLHNMWDQFFDEAPRGAKFLTICHSQGAIHVRNALLDYPPKWRKRIVVMAIAPGAYIFQETCAKVIHYRMENALKDPVPRIDQEGDKRSRETIVDISSLVWGILDHQFQSLSYQSYISAGLTEFISK